MGTGEHYPMFGALERAELLSTKELSLPLHRTRRTRRLIECSRRLGDGKTSGTGCGAMEWGQGNTTRGSGRWSEHRFCLPRNYAFPMHPSLADEEVDRVLASIARWEEVG